MNKMTEKINGKIDGFEFVKTPSYDFFRTIKLKQKH